MSRIVDHSERDDARVRKGLVGWWWLTWLLGGVLVPAIGILFDENPDDVTWIRMETVAAIRLVLLVASGAALLRILETTTRGQTLHLEARADETQGSSTTSLEMRSPSG